MPWGKKKKARRSEPNCTIPLFLLSITIFVWSTKKKVQSCWSCLQIATSKKEKKGHFLSCFQIVFYSTALRPQSCKLVTSRMAISNGHRKLGSFITSQILRFLEPAMVISFNASSISNCWCLSPQRSFIAGKERRTIQMFIQKK